MTDTPEAVREDGAVPEAEKPQEAKKFGTFLGVYIPSILTILGVIMYLRMGWVVGNVGIFGALVIITLSTVITLITSLSISATATNMTVRAGGAYYMISRSFGLESGAAIGIPLFLAQAIGTSFYIAGFSESIHALIPALSAQLVGLSSLFVLSLLAYFSPNLALRAQVFIFLVIMGSILSLALGHPLSPELEVKPVTEAPFWVVFALFFPAVTGILSGVSMSGDLKDPGKSIPRGTIAAVITGYAVYIAIPLLLVRLAPKEILVADSMVMTRIAAVPVLIVAGIWGATLSSALGSLLSAPRTLQALAADGVVPGILGRGFGPSNDPRIATLLSFMIAAAGVYAGSLDLIAPVLTMFFLTSYGILNFAAGVESLIGNPSWRPRFKVHWTISFFGAFGCFSVMMLIDAGSAYLAFFFCALVYFLMKRRNVNARWTDTRRGLLLHMVRNQIYKLARYEETGRTWRPNLFVLSGSPSSRWYLIELADSISHGKGFLTVCAIIRSSKVSRDKVQSMEKSMRDLLEKRDVPALTKVKISEDFVEGVSGLIDDYGLGAIKPNTFVFGESEKEEHFEEFAALVQLVYRSKRNLLIVRNQDAVRGVRPEIELEPIIKRFQKKQKKVVDIWWGEKNLNAHLMLALSYLLQTSPEWVGAHLRIRSLVKDEDERQGILTNLQEFVNESRVNAEVGVLVRKPDEKPLSQIQRYSKESDLVFLGMRPPREDESSEEYAMYYEELMESTKKFPYVVITLAGENLQFRDIFKA